MCSGRGETQCIISDDSGDFSFSKSWIGKARSLGSASPGHMHLAMRLHTQSLQIMIAIGGKDEREGLGGAFHAMSPHKSSCSAMHPSHVDAW